MVFFVAIITINDHQGINADSPEQRLHNSNMMEQNTLIVITLGIGLLALITSVVVPVTLKNKTNAAMTSLEKAKKWMSETPLIDGHNDFPITLKAYYDNKLQSLDLNQRPTLVDISHTDIPRLRAGKVGGQFWSAYTSCKSNYKDPIRNVLDQIDVIRRMCDMYPETFEFVTSADGIEKAFENGKIASLIGVEGGHHIDSHLGVLRMLYVLGARYMTITHNCNTPWADNWLIDEPNNNTAEFDGLSEFGERVIKEMNRLGMLVDLSHTSKALMEDVLALPNQPPVIYSHSSAFSICASYRNVHDDVLLKVKENRGIVMVNFYTTFVNCPPKNISGDLNYATLSQVADHIEHIRGICGIDCVGIGSDFDGIAHAPEGLEDASKFPDLIAHLIERGWGESGIKKLLGENLLRVFRAVEQAAESMKKQLPDETTISRDLEQEVNNACRTSNFQG